METSSQPVPPGISHNHSRSATPRGRGRSRCRRAPQTDHTPKPELTWDASDKLRQTNHSVNTQLAETTAHGQFEDPESDISLRESHRGVKHIPMTSTPVREKGTTSDKENSCSPKPQRSRRAVFDSGIMSQINSHLRKGVYERTDINLTRSLDRLNKVGSPSAHSRNMHLSRLVSPDLKIQIPSANVTSDANYGTALHEELIAEGRPRSNTDPVSPPSIRDWGERPAADTQTKSSGLLSMSQATHLSKPSVPSPLSVTKPKGRGRSRGRARNKHPEMEVTRPGAASENCPDPDHPLPQDKNRNREQFSDAASTTTSSSGVHHASFKGDGLPPSTNKSASSSAGDGSGSLTSGSSRPSSAGENSSKSEAAGEHGSESATGGRSAPKGLTLKIGKDEQSPAPEPDMYSPDDITLLLSPNHQYTLDWAAAMATPPPSSDSAPDWDVTARR